MNIGSGGSKPWLGGGSGIQTPGGGSGGSGIQTLGGGSGGSHHHANGSLAGTKTLGISHHAMYSTSGAIVTKKFGKIGFSCSIDDEITDVEIFDSKINEEDFNKIDSSNSMLLQFDGVNFKIDGKQFCTVNDTDKLGEMLVSQFALRCLRK